MRALMLTPDEGHLDRRIAQEAATLSRHGWEVDIHPAVDPDLDYEDELAPSVHLLPAVVPRRTIGTRRRILRAGRRAVGRRLPVLDRAVEIARYRRVDPATTIAAANLERLSAMPPYDLLVAHDVPVFPLAVALKRRWGSTLVCDLHEVFPEQDEYFTTPTARAYWRRIEGHGLAAADGILCVNDAVADYARTAHRPRAPLGVVHNSVPFVPRAALLGRSLRDAYRIPPDARVMLFAGSLRPHKNLEALVEGFGRAELPGWVLAILGDGPLADALRSRVRRRRLDDRVLLGQRAPQRDLVSMAASADVGLLPYLVVGYNHLIATPNKLFEYIQARVPIATSRLPMIERIVSESRDGGFVDFATADTIAVGLVDFVAGALPLVTGDALEAAARRWSWEHDEPVLLDVVDRAMSGVGDGRR